MTTSQVILALAKRGLSVEFGSDLENSTLDISIMEPHGDLYNCIQNVRVTFECAEFAAVDAIERALNVSAEKVRQSKGWEELCQP